MEKPYIIFDYWKGNCGIEDVHCMECGEKGLYYFNDQQDAGCNTCGSSQVACIEQGGEWFDSLCK